MKPSQASFKIILKLFGGGGEASVNVPSSDFTVTNFSD